MLGQLGRQQSKGQEVLDSTSTRVFHIRTEMPIVAFSSLLCENQKVQCREKLWHGYHEKVTYSKSL